MNSFNNPNFKIWKIFLPFLLGVAIFVLALRFIGFGEILESLRGLNIFQYSLAVCCIIGSILLWTLRWKFFIEAEGHEVSTFDLFKNLMVGLSVNNLTPLAKLGGEPVRAYLLKIKHGIKMREGLASVFADLTTFFVVMLSFILLSLLLVPLVISPPSWIALILIPFTIAAGLILAGIIGVYSGRDIIVKIIEWICTKIERLKPYKDKLIKRYTEFQNAFRSCLKNRKAFSKALTAAVLAKGLNVAKFFLIFKALGFQISLGKLIIGMGISTIILILPTTPGSLGVYGSAFISIFALLGVPPQTAATAVFLDRLVWFWGVTIVGGSLGAYYGINIWNSERV